MESGVVSSHTIHHRPDIPIQDLPRHRNPKGNSLGSSTTYIPACIIDTALASPSLSTETAPPTNGLTWRATWPNRCLWLHFLTLRAASASPLLRATRRATQPGQCHPTCQLETTMMTKETLPLLLLMGRVPFYEHSLSPPSQHLTTTTTTVPPDQQRGGRCPMIHRPQQIPPPPNQEHAKHIH